MPKIIPAIEETYKTQIRGWIASRSKISARIVADALNIDKNYANKLIKEVYEDSIKELDQKKVREAVSQTRLKFQLMNDKLFELVLNDKVKMRETEQGVEVEVEVPMGAKLKAMSQIKNNELALFEILFSSGIFKKDLGKLDIGTGLEGQVDMISLYNEILQRVDESTRQQIIAITNEFLSRSPILEGDVVEE